MLNQVVLVGIVKAVRYGTVDIDVERNYAEKDGSFAVDTVTVCLAPNGTLAQSVQLINKSNVLIGVKGRLEMYNGNLVVWAEKLTVLQ